MRPMTDADRRWVYLSFSSSKTTDQLLTLGSRLLSRFGGGKNNKKKKKRNARRATFSDELRATTTIGAKVKRLINRETTATTRGEQRSIVPVRGDRPHLSRSI